MSDIQLVKKDFLDHLYSLRDNDSDYCNNVDCDHKCCYKLYLTLELFDFFNVESILMQIINNKDALVSYDDLLQSEQSQFLAENKRDLASYIGLKNGFAYFRDKNLVYDTIYKKMEMSDLTKRTMLHLFEGLAKAFKNYYFDKENCNTLNRQLFKS